MSTIRKYHPFHFAGLLLCIILFWIYPNYQYFVDPDAISYLTISKRYAVGDFQKAVNGYWSPWSCWLTAALIAKGIAPFKSAIIINAIGALGFLYISQSLFILYNVTRRMQWLLCMVLSVFLCYAIFKQSFDDLWECFFLLVSLRVLLSPGFERKPSLWIATGVVGALAYFAKAYSFPFFILNTICCSFFIAKAWHKDNRRHWLLIGAISIGAMFVCSFPWIWLLHDKYGTWMTSSAGSLNMSWYLVGHPYFKQDILQLVPPVYPDAVSYWEDPYMANGATPHFWHSFHLFGLQFLRAGYNVLKLLLSMSEISAFMLPAYLLSISMLVSINIRRFFGRRMLVITLSFLLFPVGYLLINFEARYIWYMVPLLMVVGTNSIARLWPAVYTRRIISALFAASFLVWPIYDMSAMYRGGEKEHMLANRLKQLGIKGSYSANTVFGDANYISTQQLAYFSGSVYYPFTSSYVPYGNLLYDLRKYRVKYFFYYYDGIKNDADYIMKDEHRNPFPELTGGKIEGLKVFLLSDQVTKEGFLNAVIGQVKIDSADTIFLDERANSFHTKGTLELRKLPRKSLMEILTAGSTDTTSETWHSHLLYNIQCVDSTIAKAFTIGQLQSKVSGKPKIIYRISKPVFDTEHKYAVMSVSYRLSGAISEITHLYIFRNDNQHWKVKTIARYVAH